MSNIAWAPDQLDRALDLMVRHGATGLEIAPGLAFQGEDDPFAPSLEAVNGFKARLGNIGVDVVSMQSLLFGVPDALMFGTSAQQDRFIEGIERCLRLAGVLEIPNLVFGSPKNRTYLDDLSAEQVEDHAASIFKRLGDRAQHEGTRLSLEPVPAVYGTNFLTTTEDTARFISKLAHAGITMTFDTGALFVNDEIDGWEETYSAIAPKVSHVHISEPDLGPVPAQSDTLRDVSNALLRRGYGHWFSIEMRQPEGDALKALDHALAGVSAMLRHFR